MAITQRLRASFLLGAVLVMMTSVSVWAQGTEDPRIDRIHQQYEAIDDSSRHYTVRKRDNDYKNSHDSFTGFYKGKDLRKIVVVSNTEQYQITAKIYLQGGHIFFAQYSTTKSSSVSDAKGVASEERYYFAQDRLIRWLGPEKIVKPTNSAEARGAVNALQEWRQEAVAALTPTRR